MKGKTVAIIVAFAALVSGGAIAATLLTSGSDDVEESRSLVPEDTFLYMSASRELSDDQRAACDSLAASFPEGFDCEALGEKVREALDDEFADMDQDITYEENIEPWLGTDFTLFMTTDNLAEMVKQSQEQPSFDMDMATEQDFEDFEQEMEERAENAIVPTFAFLISVEDEAQAKEFVLDVAADQDEDFEEKTYEDTPYYYESGFAWGLIDGHLVGGTEDGIKAVIDQTDADTSIEDDERFAAALDSVRDERLGMAYVDLQPVFDAFRDQIPAGFPPGVVQAFSDVVEQPITASAFLEDDAAVVEMTSNGAFHDLFGYALPGGGGSDALAKLPADAWGAIAVDDVAGQVNTILQFASSAFPGGSVVLEQQFKQSTGLDLQDDVLGWMGPSALFIGGETPTEMHGGMTIETSDPTKTAETILRVERLLAREGMPTRLITRAGFRGFISKIPGQSQGGILAVDDERAVGLIGTPQLLDELADGETLESSDRFSQIQGALGEEFAIGTFVDIDTVRELIESSEPLDQDYVDNIQPFLEPLDLFIYGTAQEDGVTRDRYVVNVDE